MNYISNETKTCKTCGETFPVDYKYWRWKDNGKEVKPLPNCKKCTRIYEAQKQRERREQKKRAMREVTT